jgi:hypothetical protein
VAARGHAQNCRMKPTGFANGGDMSATTFHPGNYIGQQVRTDDGRLWEWTGVRWVYLGA